MRSLHELLSVISKNAESTSTLPCVFEKCGVHMNSPLYRVHLNLPLSFKKMRSLHELLTVSSSRLVHVVKMEWGVDTNSAFCKNRWEVETNPAFLENIVGSSSRFPRGGVRVNSAFFKSRVGSSSGLRIFGEHSREFVGTPHF